MLVLSRKINESIHIGQGVTVTVTRISGNRVTLGVTAPNDVKIIRSELKPFDDAPAAPAPVAPLRAPLTMAGTLPAR